MSLEATIRRLAGKKLPVNEETAKRQAIEPILEALGWDVADRNGNQEVRFEYAIRTKGQSGKADIALMEPEGSRRCVCLVEAKSPDKNLDDHVDQLNNYAKIEGVDIAVLTNVREWRIFYPRERGRIDDCQVACFEITDTPEELAVEMRLFLGRPNLLSGKAANTAKRRLREQRRLAHLQEALPELWADMLNAPDPDLVQLIATKASERELEASPEQIAALLKREEIASAHHQTSNEKKQATPKTRPARSRASSYTLWGEKYPVRSSMAVVVGVCTQIWQLHKAEFSKATKVPRSLGRKDTLISRDSSTLHRPKPIGNSEYYVDTNNTAEGSRSFCMNLLEAFGHSRSDLTVEYNLPKKS